MCPTLTHADYSRGRLLRLLDWLEARPPGAIELTLSLPAATPCPELPALGGRRAALIEHAARSATGAVVFAGAERSWIVAPPFSLVDVSTAPGAATAPLRAMLSTAYLIGAVLLRRGGYAIGVYEGDRMLAAKNDAPFVKNRHRKGGQSQRRFDRIREKQIHELFADVCDEAEQRLAPWAGRLDFLAYGGDRRAVVDCLKECRYLREFSCPVLPRFLTVPEPRHETLVNLPSLLYTSRVTEVYG